MNTINFYKIKDPFGEFSNFALFPIKLDNKVWATTEHYFQAQKFKDENIKEKIRAAKKPSIAAKLGRDRSKPLRKDWESIKNNVMKKAVKAKFTQHITLKNLLLSTKNAKLVEHTVNDSYWGDGGDGSGKNMLGKILMEIREEIKNDI
jgi:ribA/ribD-fused uncharacterized protein